MDGMTVIKKVQLSGAIKTHPMFSGVGYFLDDAMFGIDFDGVFYVKANGVLIKQYKKEGWRPYVYRKPNEVVTNYYEIPEEYLSNQEYLGSLLESVISEAKHDLQLRLERKACQTKLRELPNMRLSTEVLLKQIDIVTVEEFREVGAAQVYVWIRDRLKLDVSERLLFRLEGALVKQHWMCLGKAKEQLLREQVLILS
ncbi:TfoX/Sxy family DNA transformation protein [Vibrio mediterranei]|nr:TfoX/Sxy family DNA transformation protein [Vibrio mediterranei]